MVLSTICVYVSVFADDHKIAVGSNEAIVAVGINGSDYSLDLITWNHSLGVWGNLNSVTSGAGKIVAVGNSTILYSSDGNKWDRSNSLFH